MSLIRKRDKSHTWAEKYRPTTLDDVIGQDDAIRKIRSFLPKKGKEINFPHLLFVGPPGVGKTSTVNALVWEIYKDMDLIEDNFMFVNASDNRRLEDMRKQVIPFASTTPIDTPFKVAFLSEMGNLTRDSQKSLQTPLESYSDNCKFVFDLNDITGVEDPILDRVEVVRFYPLLKKDIILILEKVAQKENIEGVDFNIIAEVSNGSARRAIRILQTGDIPDDKYFGYPKLLLNMAINYIDKTDNSEHLEEMYSLLQEFFRGGLTNKYMTEKVAYIIASLPTDKLIRKIVGNAEIKEIYNHYVKHFKLNSLDALSYANSESRQISFAPIAYLGFFSLIAKEYSKLKNKILKVR